MSWVPGLCSVTFRQLSPVQIVERAAAAGLRAIEWGTDVHAPPGDLARARELASLCHSAGLACPTLGSYARATASARSQPWSPLLDTAEALGATTVRIWAGESGFAETDNRTRHDVADAVRNYAESASARGLKIALEYHPDTLTDCRRGAAWLLEQVAHPALKSYWQPVPDQPVEDCRDDLDALGEHLAHLHMFFWRGERIRYPLSEGGAYWARILNGRRVPRGGHAFLEFVPGDDPACLGREAAALLQLLGPEADPGVHQ
ncbi:MAG: TIM barrel protein [Geminicoccaceae bacterium]|nr:TIM barrel protein [Geminicoccaceae bacterium]MCB9944041.1 TIM barrel protein [Geminicoccaceae bacterium]